jgi:hypothetical protein
MSAQGPYRTEHVDEVLVHGWDILELANSIRIISLDRETILRWRPIQTNHEWESPWAEPRRCPWRVSEPIIGIGIAGNELEVVGRDFGALRRLQPGDRVRDSTNTIYILTGARDGDHIWPSMSVWRPWWRRLLRIEW